MLFHWLHWQSLAYSYSSSEVLDSVVLKLIKGSSNGFKLKFYWVDYWIMFIITLAEGWQPWVTQVPNSHVMQLSITPKDYGLCFTLLTNILRHVLFVDVNDFSCSNRLLFRVDNGRCLTLPESPGSYQTAGNFNTCVEDCWTTNLLAEKKRFWFCLAEWKKGV